MTEEELKRVVVDGIREALRDWRQSGGERVVEVEQGLELSFRLASAPNDHVFEVSTDKGYYKVNIEVERWD